MKLIVFWLLFSAAASPLLAQVTPQTIPPFKSLCIAEEASGLDWENGKWKHTRFKPEKYILEKIDYEKTIISEKIIDQPISCSKPNAIKFADEKFIVTSCYALKIFGRVSMNLLDANDCEELFTAGKIEAITCKGVGIFLPNGPFIRLPPSKSLDISADKEKNSLVVSAGTCGVL
jgi:hypothetical protein